MSVAVVVLGALGALARAEIGWALQRRTGATRTGTWVVNLTGATALGAVLGLTLPDGIRAAATDLLGVGFLGGFTTFSTWMVEAVAGDAATAATGPPRLQVRDLAAHVGGMLVAGLAAAAFGWWLGSVA